MTFDLDTAIDAACFALSRNPAWAAPKEDRLHAEAAVAAAYPIIRAGVIAEIAAALRSPYLSEDDVGDHYLAEKYAAFIERGYTPVRTPPLERKGRQ